MSFNVSTLGFDQEKFHIGQIVYFNDKGLECLETLKRIHMASMAHLVVGVKDGVEGMKPGTQLVTILAEKLDERGPYTSAFLTGYPHMWVKTNQDYTGIDNVGVF